MSFTQQEIYNKAKQLVEQNIYSDVTSLVENLIDNGNITAFSYESVLDKSFDGETEEYQYIFEYYTVSKFFGEFLEKNFQKDYIVENLHNGTYLYCRKQGGQAVFLDFLKVARFLLETA